MNYEFTFQIPLTLTPEQMERIKSAYDFIEENGTIGLYDNIEEFIQNLIEFRLLRHINENMDYETDLKLYMSHGRQT